MIYARKAGNPGYAPKNLSDFSGDPALISVKNHFKIATPENNRNIETWSDEFVIIEDEGDFGFLPLAEQTYQYVFVVTDIFGNTFFSDMATFEMKYTYEYLLENPLPDGTYAADVTNIEPYNK